MFLFSVENFKMSKFLIKNELKNHYLNRNFNIEGILQNNKET